MTLKVEDLTNNLNIAESLDEEHLNKIGSNLCDLIDNDIQSRSEWEERNDRWLKLAQQVIESKSYPWPNASNIKIPLLNTAAVQFHSRSYAALLGNRDVVLAKVLGKDPLGERAASAQRVSSFMSYQITEEMEDWLEEMDRLLFLLPIVGLVFKKTYHDGERKRSEMIHPRDLIINYHAVDYDTARMTHRLYLNNNQVKEYINEGLYLDIKSETPETPDKPKLRDELQGLHDPNTKDELSTHEFYEVHDWLDLDDDGYNEPYIITINKTNKKVYRIVARWEDQGLILSDSKIIKIIPSKYFTAYQFMPDPESKVYALGFGVLLGPINEAVNTLGNQLIDSGNLNNLGGGFLARGIRSRGGAMRFRPGEWKTLQTPSEDLRKSIFPMPVGEPSQTLFQLLGLLIDSAKDLSSVQDLMVGRNPGQNQPHATTQDVLEQGLKVFNGIYKRIYRSMTFEFKKLFELNIYYPEYDLYEMLTGSADTYDQDFSLDMKIKPSAEPDMVAEAQKIIKANALIDKMSAGMPLNIQLVTRKVLEAENHEDVDELMQVPPPQPPFEVMLEQEQFAHQKEMDYLNLELDTLKVQSQALRDRTAAYAQVHKTELEEEKLEIEKDSMVLESFNKEQDRILKRLEILKKEAQTKNDSKQDK